MTSYDIERQEKLKKEFDNVYQEHNRLQQDLNSDLSPKYQPLLNSIDKWEEDAIRKIQKTAENARHDVRKFLKEANQQLEYILNNTVTEKLRETIQQENKLNEINIDQWLVYLSEIRKQCENISSSIEFSYKNAIQLIKIRRSFPLKTFQAINVHHKQFNFVNIRGRPIIHQHEHVISSIRPSTIVSQNKYTTGTHYFRFRIERNTKELFFGIISEKDDEKLKQNRHPIESIHGWWNIDRRVIAGRKDEFVSTLDIYNGDEVVLILNCNAREIFLEYPSMNKLNAIKMIDDIRVCSPPWKLLIEIGKPGKCLLSLIEWGLTARRTDD
ncbi:hypothetical protein I4U23_019686 [Adineta vaga]|nr:hypothetical protein I4U23_019686 [Adineta vaga]